jgi:hypothetical protein
MFESKEQELKQQVMLFQDRSNRQQIELGKLRDSYQSDVAQWEREKARIIGEMESKMMVIETEKERVLADSNIQLKSKITELNQKFENTVRRVQENDIDTVRQEMIGTNLRNLAEMQQKCQQEVETVRSEEKKKLLLEVEKVRNIFVQREKETTEDLIQLENLHATRVNQLENQILSLKKENELLLDELQKVQMQSNKGMTELSYNSDQFKDQLQSHVFMAEQLNLQLASVNKNLQECQVRERSYRDQLARSLEENKVLRMQFVEAKEQVFNYVVFSLFIKLYDFYRSRLVLHNVFSGSEWLEILK